MVRRDEEIFRKLNKETPLAKRKDLQPLSTNDFRNSAKDSVKVKRVVPKTAQRTSSKQTSRRGAELASRYNSGQRQSAVRDQLDVFGESKNAKKASSASVKPIVKETVSRKSSRKSEERGLTAEQTKKASSGGAKSNARETANRKPQQTEGLDLFTQKAATKPAQTLRVDRGNHPAESIPRVDHHDVDYLQMPVQRDMASFPYNRLSSVVQQESKNGGQLDFRHELKFYINHHDYILLRNTIKTLLSIDRNANEDGQYYIRSLYFDDACETALTEKIIGCEERSKYRIRIYNYSDDVIKFEKKIKRGQFISKVSIGLTRDECNSLISGDYNVLLGRLEPLANEIYLQMVNNALKPRVIVDYWREAYVSPFENVRITFDKDIKGGLWMTDIFNDQAPTMPVLDQGSMVLEVKFNRYMPEFIKAILSNVNEAQRSAISKYVLCRKFD